MITPNNVDDVFSPHVPDATDLEAMDEIRRASIAFAKVILSRVPQCADQQAALRKVREAQMTANVGLMTRGAA